jgi:hypothetical protein
MALFMALGFTTAFSTPATAEQWCLSFPRQGWMEWANVTTAGLGDVDVKLSVHHQRCYNSAHPNGFKYYTEYDKWTGQWWVTGEQWPCDQIPQWGNLERVEFDVRLADTHDHGTIGQAYLEKNAQCEGDGYGIVTYELTGSERMHYAANARMDVIIKIVRNWDPDVTVSGQFWHSDTDGCVNPC